MSDYEKEKEEYQTQTTTGFINDDTSGSSFWLGHYLEGGCQKASRNRIAYNIKHKFNACSHVKEWSYVGRPAWVATYTNRMLSYRGGSFNAQTPPTYSMFDSRLEIQRPVGSITIGPSGEAELKAFDAYNKLIHLNPPRHMNALRSGMELKDTKQTVNGMLDFIKWGHTHLGRTVVVKGVQRRLSLLTNVVTFAQAYLTYQFGIAPTVSDAKQFLREISQGKLRVKGNKLKTEFHKGDVVVTRWSTRPSAADVRAAMFYDSESGQNTHDEWVTVYAGSSNIVVPLSSPTPKGWSRARTVISRYSTGCYFAEVTEDLVIEGLDELKRRWEWNCPSFRTLWDLCPFSFLVDWLVDVGRFIERLEKRWIAPSYERKLGPIWSGTTTREDTYYPQLQRFDLHVADAKPPQSPGNGGSFLLRWDWSADAYLGARKETFVRKPLGAAPTAVWPELMNRVRAYQISTGMALVLSHYRGLNLKLK